MCHATNYDVSFLSIRTEKVDNLLCVQIGGTVVTLCEKCALRLLHAIETHILNDHD